jgi:SAM-dependent methyltransferase
MSSEMRACCPACGGQGGRVIGRKNDWALVRCPACRVRAKYLDEYDLAAHFEPFADRKRVLYERRLARLPRPQPGHDRLCDVGCADGQFLQIAREHGWSVCGVELNPPAAARARERGAAIFEGCLEDLDALPWGTFDLVTSWDSLEHTPRPVPFVERLVRLLEPGGTLGLTTLNQPSLAWRFLGTRWSMVVDDHYTYWNARSLCRLMERMGLRITDVDIFGLGRDFVSFASAGRGKTKAAEVPGEPGPKRRSRAGWDVRAETLVAEAVLNRIFRLVGGGVGIGVIARRRANSGSSSTVVSAGAPRFD